MAIRHEVGSGFSCSVVLMCFFSHMLPVSKHIDQDRVSGRNPDLETRVLMSLGWKLPDFFTRAGVNGLVFQFVGKKNKNKRKYLRRVLGERMGEKNGTVSPEYRCEK